MSDVDKHWLVTLSHGKYFLGRLHGRSSEKKKFTLNPVLEVKVEEGAVAGLWAPFGLVSVEQLDFPDDSIVVQVSDLSDAERQKLLGHASSFLEMLKKARKGQSRLVVPGS